MFYLYVLHLTFYISFETSILLIILSVYFFNNYTHIFNNIILFERLHGKLYFCIFLTTGTFKSLLEMFLFPKMYDGPFQDLKYEFNT